MTIDSYFDTIVAFGDSFSSQCGPCHANSEELCMRSWSDLSTGLYGNAIRNGCSVNKGWNYVNFLSNCTQDNIDPLSCPIRMIDLAYGGASALKDYSVYEEAEEGLDLALLQLDGQIALWRESVRKQLTFKSEKLLSIIWFGLNDIRGLTESGLEESIEGMHANILELKIFAQLVAIRDGIEQLYEDGVRNFFIPNIPLDITDAAGTIMTWNQMLKSSIENWSSEFVDGNFLTFDTYAMYNTFQASPAEYGFDNIIDMCFLDHLDDPSLNCTALSNGYLRMDFVHWTAQAHHEMAKIMETSIDAQMSKIIEAQQHMTITIPKLSTPEICSFLGLLSIFILGLTLLIRSLTYKRRSQLSDKLEAQLYSPLDATES